MSSSGREVRKSRLSAISALSRRNSPISVPSVSLYLGFKDGSRYPACSTTVCDVPRESLPECVAEDRPPNWQQLVANLRHRAFWQQSASKIQETSTPGRTAS